MTAARLIDKYNAKTLAEARAAAFQAIEEGLTNGYAAGSIAIETQPDGSVTIYVEWVRAEA